MNRTIDNSALGAKLAIRSLCKEWVGPEVRVLDCFAGAGKMRELCYSDAAAYLGIEQKPEHARPGVWTGDNLRLIPQAFKAGSWNLIDLDAHGNPYLALYQVARYAPAGPYAIAMTDGMMRNLIRPQVAKFVRWATKFPAEDGRFLVNWYDDFVRWSLAEARRMKVRECKRAIKDPRVKSVVYYGLRVEMVGPPTGLHV